MAALLLPACEKDRYGDPPQTSVPAITSAVITPAEFTYGDRVTLTAVVADPETPLSALEVSLVLGDRIVPVTTIDLRTGETGANVSTEILVPLVNEMPDNAPVKFLLRAVNIRNGATASELTGFTGRRPYFSQLYLVVENGGVYPLAPAASERDRYAVADAMLTRSFTYRIAQKITADNQIDYSGLVWGDRAGKIQLVGEDGSGIFAFAGGADYTSSFVFDNYQFTATVSGSVYATPNLMLDNFDGQVTIDGETFYRKAIALSTNDEYSIYNELAAADVVFNLDFFERTGNKVKFLGESGSYTLYYNPVRKNVIVGVNNPSYPDYLLACGFGLGYPTHVTSAAIGAVYSDKVRTHTSWGFGHILQYVLFRRVSSNVYQGTVYMPGDHDHYAGFGLYENSSWANQKRKDQFTFTGEAIISGEGNWDIPNGDTDPVIPSDNFRITIDLNTNTVNIVKFQL
jgi:hypothetical protein